MLKNLSEFFLGRFIIVEIVLVKVILFWLKKYVMLERIGENDIMELE